MRRRRRARHSFHVQGRRRIRHARRAGQQCRHRRHHVARRRDVRRTHPAHDAGQHHRQHVVRARGGEADVDPARRPGRRYRQPVVGGGKTRRAQHLCRLRGVQGCDRFLHHRSRPRSRRGGHPRRSDKARADRYRNPCLGRRSRPRPTAQPPGADETRRQRRRGRQRHRLADVGRCLLCDQRILDVSGGR